MDASAQPRDDERASLKKRISDRLRSAREDAGMTREQVSRTLGAGFSEVSLYRWETGRDLPSFDKIVQLSDLFSVSLDWIADRSEHRGALESGKVIVGEAGNAFLEHVENSGGSLADIPDELIRHPGLDVAWKIPERFMLLDSGAAELVERRIQRVFERLKRGDKR